MNNAITLQIGDTRIVRVSTNEIIGIGSTVAGPVGATGPQGPTGATGAGGALGYWGSFWSTQTQSAANTTTAYALTLNNTDSNSSGVSIVDNSKITFAYAGVYDVQFSAQLDRITSSGLDTVDIWFRKNGTDVADSNTVVTVSGNAAEAKTVAAWNYVLDVDAGDYVQLMFRTSDVRTLFPASAAGTSPTRPAVPSVIVTATQVMYTQLGPTGATGPQGDPGIDGYSGDFVYDDYFTRANSTTSIGGSWTTNNGTWGITANKAYQVTAGGAAAGVVTVDAGSTRHRVTALCNAGSGNNQGVVVRYVDADNYVYMQCTFSFGTWNVRKRVAGVDSFVGNLGTVATTDAIASLVVTGTTFTASINNGQVVSFTISDAALQTGTRAGLYMPNAQTGTSFTFDNASVKSIFSGPQGIQGDKGDTGDTGSSGVIAVTAPITNTGTSTSANIGVSAASTSAAGVVQLTDSTTSTSTTTAATANSVKSAIDRIEEYLHGSSSVVDVFSRSIPIAAVNTTSGQARVTYFTATHNMTVSAITFISAANASSGLTLARFGLYDATTLVARTASDTTLFNSASTSYTRSFDTAGGYPATFDLVAGTRYGVAMIVVGTTAPSVLGINHVAPASGTYLSLTPRVNGVTASLADLAASPPTTNNANLLWARLS